MFELPAWLLAWFYGLTHNYAISIALIAVVVMLIITPLTLKSTKGMLEMQRLAPQMRKLQQLHRNDRQKLNEEMMKLYQEHKVNPMSSCLPLVAQMPVFIIMFRILHGLTYKPVGAAEPIANAVFRAANQTPPQELGFVPRYISNSSELFESLSNGGRFNQTEMVSFGLDLAKSPIQALSEGLGDGADLRHPGRRPRRAVLPPAADGGGPRGGQPDDVADAAEADAVPARRVRHLPGLLPGRPDHLLHGPGRAAHRSAGLHHQALLRPRGVARSPGPTGRRRSTGAGEKGRWGWWAVRRGQARHACRRRSRRTPAPRTTSKRTTPPKGRPTPTGKTPAGPRPGTTGRPGGNRAKSSGKRRR